VHDAWDRLEAWFEAHLPHTRKAFNPPAKASLIKAFEKAIGLELPDSVRESYRRHNGHKPCSAGLLFGLPLHPLETALKHWDNWKGYDRTKLRKFNFDDEVSCFPTGFVQSVYFTRGWIPISDDAGGNHIAVDLAPGPNGKRGQIIVCGRDDTFHPVLARDWAQFLADIATELERGNWSIEEHKYDRKTDYEFNLAAPKQQHFHEVGANWSRCKLGLRKLSKQDETVWNKRRRK
jgi:cell wall assembly regulator SMI1